MTDDEKRRVAEMVGRGMDSEQVTACLLYNGKATHDRFWWRVMDWVKSKGWKWDSSEGYWSFGATPEQIEACRFYCDEIEGGERWARLSCVAQAIEAGVL